MNARRKIKIITNKLGESNFTVVTAFFNDRGYACGFIDTKLDQDLAEYIQSSSLCQTECNVFSY